MNQDFKCAIGMHKFEVYKEQIVRNIRNEEIGIAVVNRCKYCGKIIIEIIPTLQI